MFPQVFRRFSTGQTKEKEEVNETVRTLIDARIDRLESAFALLRAEWAEVYDKVMHLHERTRKRIKAAEKREEPQEPIVQTQPLPQTRSDVLRQYLEQNGA